MVDSDNAEIRYLLRPSLWHHICKRY